MQQRFGEIKRRTASSRIAIADNSCARDGKKTVSSPIKFGLFVGLLPTVARLLGLFAGGVRVAESIDEGEVAVVYQTCTSMCA